MADLKDLSKINPLSELKKTFKGHEKATVTNVVISFFVCSLITGTAYEYW